MIEAADLTIGNDSGFCHLAGVLQARTLAICGPTARNLFAWYRTVETVEPYLQCRGCYWRSDRGYRRACSVGCEALAETTAARVMDAARLMLDRDFPAAETAGPRI